MKDVLAVILAGGKGSRLEPLTRDRAKPAVPFGGAYRIIDFTLSNCLNSGVRKNLVLTQYKAMSLDRHINLGWQSLSLPRVGRVHRRRAAPAAHRRALVSGHRRRRLPEHLHDRERAAEVRRDPRRRPHLQDELRQAGRAPHRDQRRSDGRHAAGRRAGGGGPVRRRRGRRRQPRGRASRRSRRIRSPIPGDPHRALASMGIYVFIRPVPLRAALPRRHPARQPPRLRPRHDPGGDRHAPRVRLSVHGREPQDRRPTGATWARWTPTTTPTWT